MPKNRKPIARKPKIIPLTNIQLAFNISEIIGEDTPKNRFNIWSYICIVGQDRAIKAITQAKDLHLAETTRTLSGCWFNQFTDYSAMAHRIRQGFRQAIGAPAHSTPECFGYEELSEEV